MIKIENVDKRYLTCDICDSNEGVKFIVLDDGTSSSKRFKLCKKHLKELKQKL